MGLRIAMLSVHTSPLEQPGSGDAGGMNVYIAEVSKALARLGANVEVFTRATSSTQPPLAELADGVLVRHVAAGPFGGMDKEDLPGQLCAFTAGVLRAEARRAAGWYDVVHSHYWLSGQVGWLVADRWDVPLVHTAHTLARVKNAALPPGDAPEPLLRIVGEEQVVAAADALVASTDDEAADLVKDYQADPLRVHVVSPGVDLATFHPASDDSAAARAALRHDLTLPPDGGLVLFAGRIQPLKAPDLLVQALGVLARRGDPVPTLVVLGGSSGRPTAVRELQALAHQEGISDRVLIRPPVAPPELARYYRAADLVAVPSHNESFGLVAAEAQACGTPVVAAAVGGLRSVVSDGVSGILMRDRDPQAWATTLRDLLADPDRRATLRAGARLIGGRLGWEHSARAMLGVYAAAEHDRAQRRELPESRLA